jgi:hypothetical protein
MFGRLVSTRMTHLLLLWGREKKPGGSREEYMQGHTGKALSQGSNKEACSMKAQWHAAHRSMQDGAAGAAWYCGSVQSMPHDTALAGGCQHALAEHCLVGTRSMC